MHGDGFSGGFLGGAPPLFSIIFTVIALVIGGTILYAIINGIRVWSNNNAAERMTEEARVLARRTYVSGGSGDSSARTSYYITFERGDGQRTELQVKDEEYGLIVEGDRGILSYQGTRFLGFERFRPTSSEQI
ncbi:hypothetical protein BK126_01585 [Paenibacillus sp. FSL H7-0326]|nr:hypothetical protein BK126_01585 [Paenibacillus sp. FSL H7-0326]